MKYDLPFNSDVLSVDPTTYFASRLVLSNVGEPDTDDLGHQELQTLRVSFQILVGLNSHFPV